MMHRFKYVYDFKNYSKNLSGAELIESLRRTQVKIQAKHEKEILEKIKQKMDRIKATQQKLQTTSVIHSRGKKRIETCFFFSALFLKLVSMKTFFAQNFHSGRGENISNNFSCNSKLSCF